MCDMYSEGHRFEDPKMMKPKQGERYIDYFIYFLPVNFFKDIILKKTNKEMMIGRGGEIMWGGAYAVRWALTFDVHSRYRL